MCTVVNWPAIETPAVKLQNEHSIETKTLVFQKPNQSFFRTLTFKKVTWFDI